MEWSYQDNNCFYYEQESHNETLLKLPEILYKWAKKLKVLSMDMEMMMMMMMMQHLFLCTATADWCIISNILQWIYFGLSDD